MDIIDIMDIIDKSKYVCIGCNEIFDIKKSLDLHQLYCIYYNYKKISIYKNFNNEYIKQIINIIFEIENYNFIDENFIKITDILNNKPFKDHDAKIKNIYKTIKNLKIDYISYNELMHLIAIYFSIEPKEINKIILCYKKCKKIV